MPLAAYPAQCDDRTALWRTPMKPVKHYPLRKIAENELAQHFDDLDTTVMNELATSVVRQWLTNDGHAGIITPTHECWFHLVTKGESLEVGFAKAEGNLGLILSRDWHVDDDEIPGLLHQLNLCQSVLCPTADGPAVRVWVEPKEQTVRCEEWVGEEG
jgi:hypothetical protein